MFDIVARPDDKIVPFNYSIEDGLKLHSLLLPYNETRMRYTSYLALDNEVIDEIAKQKPFTQEELDQLETNSLLRERVKQEIYFFYRGNDLVGLANIVILQTSEPICDVGIVIRHDLQGQGLGTYFAKMFMAQPKDTITSFKRRSGKLIKLVDKDKNRAQARARKEELEREARE